MKYIIKKLNELKDPRQKWKIKHKIGDIVAITLFAMIANANEWCEIAAFAEMNEEFMRKHLELPNGIPSHDTIQRVMSIVEPSKLQELQLEWNKMLNTNESEKLKKILNIDGKTMRDSGNKNQKPLHVVSAWSKEDGICFGQTVVKEKENEIVAIPELLKTLKIKEQVITIDAMGTQVEIAKQIVKQKGDYVLTVKGNQGNLHEDIVDYFKDESFKAAIKSSGNYKVTKEKAHGQFEKREYYQTNDIEWIHKKDNWLKLTTIGMVEKTIEKDGMVCMEKRYFISSLDIDIELFEKAVRGHWSIESMHWHLDVTFREDFNKTLDETGALNLNILRKFALAILKTLDIGKKCSQKLKRYYICSNPTKFISQILET